MYNQNMSNNKTRPSFRYLLIFYIILILLIIGSIFLFRNRIKENITSSSLNEHYALWVNNEKEKSERSVRTKLYSSTGLVTVKRNTNNSYIGLLHGALETLLTPLSEEELSMGYLSAINEKTKLIGVSEKDGYFFVSLSPEFLLSKNIPFALNEIKETLSLYFTVYGVTVLSGDESFSI